MKNRLIELEERILDRTASDAEVIEYDDLKNARTVFKAAKQTVQEFKGSLPVKPAQPVGHTPGPWKWVKFHWSADTQSDSMESNRWELVQSAYVTKDICENAIVSILDKDSSLPNEANARLIAAAPDLLEALTKLFHAAPHDMCDMLEAFGARQKHNPAVRANELNDKFADALLLAQAAIAKATNGGGT